MVKMAMVWGRGGAVLSMVMVLSPEWILCA